MSKQRRWPAPKTGLMMLKQLDAQRQEFLLVLAKDAGVPEGTRVDWDGKEFTESEEKAAHED